ISGRARICMLLEDLSMPRQLWPCLGVAPWLPFATHRRGGARICVLQILQPLLGNPITLRRGNSLHQSHA
ncbi:hypothetical protein PIB30_110956, partial [Stylosanthes scabra]|nr:hypothetical protein [Stylosanthes scabra]